MTGNQRDVGLIGVAVWKSIVAEVCDLKSPTIGVVSSRKEVCQVSEGWVSG